MKNQKHSIQASIKLNLNMSMGQKQVAPCHSSYGLIVQCLPKILVFYSNLILLLCNRSVSLIIQCIKIIYHTFNGSVVLSSSSSINLWMPWYTWPYPLKMGVLVSPFLGYLSACQRFIQSTTQFKKYCW